ncbi:MAG: tetratricopeptide repeat protein [Acidobacteriota bacterium]
MLVRRGYMLFLDPTARATVICGDGKKRELAPGAQGCPCREPCTPEVCGINYGGSTIGATRGPDTDAGLFPVVISPRKTRLRNLRPTIRWTPIAGANEKTAYNVTLYGDPMKVIWTKDVVSETRLTYPDKEPPLAPGQIYKVVVTSDGMSSQQDHSPGLGFTTLTADQVRMLADEERKRKQMQLPETQTRFLIANLYAARELYAEALEQLEDLYTTMKEAAVARMLGDIYAVIGLNREAEKRYVEALSLTPADDLEGLGLTQKSLAQVYENLGLFDRARASLAEAKRAYRRLGNLAMVNRLVKDERRLRQPHKGRTTSTQPRR